MLKRKLTEFEIEDILDFIKPQSNIPHETALSIINLTKNKLRNQLKNQELYPEIISELKKELIKNYYDCQISPGESVGILCAQSIGEKNTQNSVVYEEEIILRHQGKIFKTCVGEFIDSLMNEENNMDGNYIKLLEDYDILTISQDEKIEWKEINEISKHPTNGDLIKIKTESGREVTTTLAHSHLKRENNKILPILGSELQIGDRIPVIKKADISYIESNNDPNSIIFSWFLGTYLSFGSVFHNCVVIKNTNKQLDDLFRLNIILILSNYHKNEKVNDMVKLEQEVFYFIYSEKLVEVVKEMFGIDGYCKKVPDFIYNMSKNEMRAFLRGFFEESASISKSDKHLLCVQMILCNFGIYSRIKYTEITDECFYYKLLIQNKYKHKFYEILRTIKLDESIFEKDYETIHPDVVDEENYESDVIWEKIVELKIIKEEEYKHTYVYDFSVNDNETFGLLNGIVVHNTLNTFHRAGQNEKSVTAGVPRFQELLNATKSPKIVNCKIYFNKGNSSLKELRETINHNLVALSLKDISSNIEIKMKKEKEKWYESFKILYNNNFEEHENCLSIKLNKKLLFKYRIELQDIAEYIESTYDDLYCVFSDQDNAQIDIFIDVSKIKFNDKQLLFITDENANEIYIEECVQPILEKMIIFGIEGIESIYYMKDDTTEEWYVETDGSNFRKLLGHPIVDMTRLHSNNVWDIYESLGIEAAREFLVSEFESIMEGINSCHTKLLVEKMTFTGTINSISRYTLRKDESGVISKMTFEESVDIMVKAGFSGDVEKVNGISASIVCGKRGNIGSGFMDLKMDMNKLKNAKPVFREEDGRVIQERGGNAKFKSYNNFK